MTVTFTSEIGRTYSVYGSQDLSDPASWPEISVGDINGDGNDLDFAHIPGVTPYFLQVRED